MDAAVERSRHLRQSILRVLFIHADAGLEIGYTAAELSNLVADSIFGSDAAQTASQIRDLVELNLVRKDDESAPPRFLITVRGKDFARANYPWSKIDVYTGSQHA
ncbi:MAG: hypothetical protein BWX88_02680 [Planctomycetes bacterium ADurb.Bin126]|nr:MAG: hypothetical protein BWX88_02680 [Planctomycetes bacterium ADurb.Bin126]HOD79968.1 hypothetical protein [Phycisphaerae bacterium]HQL74025.1 hypothetical protein [Phycisphaerae bacterium]